MKIVGAKKLPCARSPSGRGRAAEDELALSAPDVDVARHLLDCAGVDERPDVDRLVQAGAQPEGPRPRLEALEQRLGDRSLHDHPRAGRAALAGRPEGRPEDAVRREVEVRVPQDDDAVLAAQLQRDALEPPAGALRDPLAGRRVSP